MAILEEKRKQAMPPGIEYVPDGSGVPEKKGPGVERNARPEGIYNDKVYHTEGEKSSEDSLIGPEELPAKSSGMPSETTGSHLTEEAKNLDETLQILMGNLDVESNPEKNPKLASQVSKWMGL